MFQLNILDCLSHWSDIGLHKSPGLSCAALGFSPLETSTEFQKLPSYGRGHASGLVLAPNPRCYGVSLAWCVR